MTIQLIEINSKRIRQSGWTRQQRINDSRKSIEADAVEIDDKFVKDCLDVNNDADKEYEIAMAAKANSAKAKGKNGGHGATDNHIADLIASRKQ